MIVSSSLRRALLTCTALSLSAAGLVLPATSAGAAPGVASSPDAPGDPAAGETAPAPRRSHVLDAPGARAVARSSARTPAAAAREYAGRWAPRWGVAADSLRVTSVVPSAAGGDVVRLQQTVDGLPVLGGDVVMSLGPGRALRSATARVTEETRLAAPRVSASRAIEVARRATAKEHHAADVTATDAGEVVWDPSVVGAPGVPGPHRVRRVEVSGPGMDRLVLVDSASGRVLADVDQHHQALNRVVCDAASTYLTRACQTTDPQVRRVEGGPATGSADVDGAYDLVGATAELYAQVGGLDLTDLVGSASQPAALRAWVHYCDVLWNGQHVCPMDNAYWYDGQMFFGDGYAGADDVVGHEMTHGVIERYSNLFYFYQSGAINESIADVMGEVLDHRHDSPGDAPDDWRLGEDLPGGAFRDLADPSSGGQPDRMTSTLYAGGIDDNGGVHTNSGVGNKTAYLVSQGGTFGGVDVGTGIDAGDPSLTRTATLFLETLRRLPSGASYADLGATLQQACDDLAATGTAGFTAGHCGTVARAVEATELTEQPVTAGSAPAPAVGSQCATGSARSTLWSNPGDFTGLSGDSAHLWLRAPYAPYGVPANAHSGATSLFAFEPDPYAYDDAPSSAVYMYPGVTIPAGSTTYLHFHHWWLMEDPDGTSVEVWVENADGTTTERAIPASAWTNGPSSPLPDGSPGFGGDSHGWTSSRLDLTPWAGRKVHIRWAVHGDYSGSLLGYYLDDMEIYSCTPPPTAPGPVVSPRAVASSSTAAVLRWTAPSSAGSGITGYRLTLPGGGTRDLGAGARSVKVVVPNRTRDWAWTLRARGVGGLLGRARSVSVRTTKASLTGAPTRARKGAAMAFRGRVRATSTTTPAAGKLVFLQVRRPASRTWTDVRTASGSVRGVRVASDGTYVLRATGTGATRYYRVVFPPQAAWLAVQSASKRVAGR